MNLSHRSSGDLDIVIGSSGPLRNVVWIDQTLQPGEVVSVRGTNIVFHTATDCDEALDIMARLGSAVDGIFAETFVVQGTWGDKLHDVSGLEFLRTFNFGGRVACVLYGVEFADGGERICNLAAQEGVRFVHFATRDKVAVTDLASGMLEKGVE